MNAKIDAHHPKVDTRPRQANRIIPRNMFYISRIRRIAPLGLADIRGFLTGALPSNRRDRYVENYSIKHVRNL